MFSVERTRLKEDTAAFKYLKGCHVEDREELFRLLSRRQEALNLHFKEVNVGWRSEKNSSYRSCSTIEQMSWKMVTLL